MWSREQQKSVTGYCKISRTGLKESVFLKKKIFDRFFGVFFAALKATAGPGGFVDVIAMEVTCDLPQLHLQR